MISVIDERVISVELANNVTWLFDFKDHEMRLRVLTRDNELVEVRARIPDKDWNPPPEELLVVKTTLLRMSGDNYPQEYTRIVACFDLERWVSYTTESDVSMLLTLSDEDISAALPLI